MKHICMLLAVPFVLVACGGGGDTPMGQANAFCYAIAETGGGAGCVGCSQVSNTGDAFDGNLESGASMGAGGQGTLYGAASTQPSGRVAGVYFVLAPSTTGITVTIRTLLNGVPQETGGPSAKGSCALSMECLDDGSEGYIGLRTTKDFNRIEATINNGSTGTAEIRELCVR